MNPKPSNPSSPQQSGAQPAAAGSLPKHTNPSSEARRARAPYNFVPLPQRIVAATEPLPRQDCYTGFSGWVDAELVTRSPLYVRGMLTKEQFSKEASDDKVEEKLARADFFAVDANCPRLPGSSLRGMVRAVVEIASFSKLRWVGDRPKVSYRAVAAMRDDPLAEPYRLTLGKFGRNVRAGYLQKDNRGQWMVLPARQPREQGWPEQNSYLKVKQEVALEGNIPNLKKMGETGYEPGSHKVWFNAQIRSGQKGAYLAVTDIGSDKGGRSYSGALVWSGDMTETADKQGGDSQQRKSKSPRCNHALVLEAKPGAPALRFAANVLDDYRDSMTEFQREKVWGQGFPEEGRPIFYIEDGGKVVAFGHSPNFRIPARNAKTGRPASPLDFVPDRLRKGEQIDLAEAIFGWTPEEDGKRTSCAGRVFFEDGKPVNPPDDLWYSEQPIIPQILGSPKPTTFQHYLVQDAKKGHSPDDRSKLAHYATSAQETVIRGHKRYWFKGAKPDIEARFDEKERDRKEKQLTRIKPLRAGVRFGFRVRFESLRSKELGALLWALRLPGAEGRRYCHALGMGKPLGMGAVEIDKIALHLTDRQARYRRLFDAEAEAEQGSNLVEAANNEVKWATSESGEVDRFVQQFEAFVLQKVAPGTNTTRLVQIERIHQLLTMMEWRGETPDEKWPGMVRYLEIEHELDRPGATEDEYKEDRVLPTPSGVIAAWQELRKGQAAAQADRPAPASETTQPVRSTRTGGAPNDLRTGRVKRFMHDKRYGFIAIDNSQDEAFVHQDKVQTGLTLQPGDHVQFRLQRGPKGWVAVEVKRVEDRK